MVSIYSCPRMADDPRMSILDFGSPRRSQMRLAVRKAEKHVLSGPTVMQSPTYLARKI